MLWVFLYELMCKRCMNERKVQFEGLKERKKERQKKKSKDVMKVDEHTQISPCIIPKTFQVFPITQPTEGRFIWTSASAISRHWLGNV